VRQKGVRYALDALARSKSATVLRIVGDGPERAQLESMAASLGLHGRVEFTGWVARSQLSTHYQWADALVLPTFEEGMANVVLEALAAGLPVITTDIYANRGLIDSGITGFLVPPADVGAIAAAFDRLAEDPALVRKLGGNSRARAFDWSWEGVSERYLHALLTAARPTAPRPDVRTPPREAAYPVATQPARSTSHDSA
jgi:glycosyltransferase involved in cell wall biosynthesis